MNCVCKVIKARLLRGVHVLLELAICNLPDCIHSTEVSSATEIHHSQIRPPGMIYQIGTRSFVGCCSTTHGYTILILLHGTHTLLVVYIQCCSPVDSTLCVVYARQHDGSVPTRITNTVPVALVNPCAFQNNFSQDGILDLL